MPIISSPEEFNEDGLYVDLRSIFGHSLALKCEGFNFAGSVKLKATLGLDGEQLAEIALMREAGARAVATGRRWIADSGVMLRLLQYAAALEMVEAAEQDGRLRPGAFLVESSSGNLGVALSVIAASRGYRFLCVTDSRCNLTTRLLMEALGARVQIITEPDPVGGLLGARVNFIKELCADDDR